MVNKGPASLLLIPSTLVVLPIADSFFEIAQFGITLRASKILNDKYKGSIHILKSGAVRRIESIRIKGFYGGALSEKITSALIGAHAIEVSFMVLAAGDLDAHKDLLRSCVENDAKRAEPFLEQNKNINDVLLQISNVSDLREVFDILQVPPAEDCLDIM